MARATEPAYPVSTSSPESGAPGHVCPFCGLTREITPDFDASTPCPRCTMSDTATTRGATKARVGPWHVRQVRNPWAPGMRFETLLALVKRGQVTKDSIVRGPTTHQLWKRAAEVKGLSREFGVCYSCGAALESRDNLCTQCNRLQEPPINPDVLVETRDGVEAGHPGGGNNAGANGHGKDLLGEPPQANLPGPRPMPKGNEPVNEAQAAMARQITSRPPAAQRKDASESRQSPKPRPVQIRPVTPGSEDALLTPQELATAFHLDFSPDRPRRRRRRRVPRAILAAIIVLLLAGGAALVGYWRPDYREASVAWGARTYAQVKNYIIARTTSPRPEARASAHSAGRPPAEAGTGNSQQTSTHGGKSARAGGVNGARPSTSAGVENAAAQGATSLPVDVVITPTAPSSPAADKAASNKPGSSVAPGASASSASAASAQVAPNSDAAIVHNTGAKGTGPDPSAAGAADPYAQAKRLWGLAIDAEANQDYAGAVAYYEQIKKLPEDVHPWGLDERLNWALKRTK